MQVRSARCHPVRNDVGTGCSRRLARVCPPPSATLLAMPPRNDRDIGVRCANLRLRAPSLTAERGEPRSTGGLGTGVGTTRRKTTPRRPAPQPPRGGRRLRGPPERKTATRYLSQTTQQVCGRLVRAWRDEHAWQRPPGLGAVCSSLRVAYSLARRNSLALRNAPYGSWAARPLPGLRLLLRLLLRLRRKGAYM